MPSDISNTRSTSAITPTVYKSSCFGSSTSISRWQTTPIIAFEFALSLIRFMDLVRPIITGKATPGKRTILRNGRIGTSVICLSIPSEKSSSLSQSVRIGITMSIGSSVINEGSENIFFLLFIFLIKQLYKFYTINVPKVQKIVESL